MISRRVGLVIAIGAVFIVLAVTPVVLQRIQAAADPLPVLGKLTGFNLTTQLGGRLSENDLSGKVWVADFIFTRCPGACPEMTSALSGLASAYADDPNFRLVSITVDPEHDTPEVLAAFAEKYSADPTRWHFLTGPKEAIDTLSEKGFMIGPADTPSAHSLRFILVDGLGRIRGYYHSNDAMEVAKLKEDVGKLLPRAGA